MSNNTIKTRGFTLIELLVVIAIIGILSSVVLASLSTARAKSRDARRVADIDQLRTALEVYFDSNSSYPNAGGAQVAWDNTKTSWTAPSIGNLTGPTTTAIAKIPNPPTGNYYYYASSSVSYLIGADLERNDNQALKTDNDTTIGASGSYTFNGLGATCAQAAAGSVSTELCYDISN